ncbi:MAG: zinc-ribbon domain-containing protein [Alphaproteobacteria bacterium]|nr:zinc-ribbon domain-containing protein [Alphaproteobacteria bacterium]
MFIIFGWGFTTKSVKGFFLSGCPKCGLRLQVIKITKWFTLFFIPIFPYSRKLYLYCERCDSYYGPFTEDDLLRIKLGLIK